MYIPITKTEEKCAGQLCYGFNIHDKLEGCTHEKKNPLWGSGFLKKGFKSNGFQIIVWSQNLSFFLFRISSQIWRFMASCEVKVKVKVKVKSESEVK